MRKRYFAALIAFLAVFIATPVFAQELKQGLSCQQKLEKRMAMGGVVVADPGVCEVVNLAIPSDTTLKGHPDVTTLEHTAGERGPTVVMRGSNNHLRNVRVDGNKEKHPDYGKTVATRGGEGPVLNRASVTVVCQSCSVTDVQIFDSITEGLKTGTKARNVLIKNSESTRAGRYGFQDFGVVDGPTRNVKFVNLTVQGSGAGFVRPGGGGGIVYRASNGLLIHGFKTYGTNGDGVTGYGKGNRNVTIRYGMVYRPGNTYMHVAGDNVKVSYVKGYGGTRHYGFLFSPYTGISKGLEVNGVVSRDAARSGIVVARYTAGQVKNSTSLSSGNAGYVIEDAKRIKIADSYSRGSDPSLIKLRSSQIWLSGNRFDGRVLTR